MIRALLFDAAGTLIEPVEPVAVVYRRHAAEAGLELDAEAIKETFAEIFSSIGDPEWDAHSNGDAAEREWWEQVVGATLCRAARGSLPEDLVGRCFVTLFAHYAAPAAWRVFPEVPEVLAAASEAGLRLAVVSNFDRRLHGILSGHGLKFERVMTSADARARKPDPSIFRQTLEHLGLSRDEVFHVGDSRRADLEGARSAGIDAFLLGRPVHDLGTFLAHALAKCGK